MPTARDLQKLSILPLFRDLEWSEIEEMTTSMQREVIAVGTDIFSLAQPSDKVCLLLDGTVKLAMQRRDEDEIVLDLCGPGDILGDIFAADALPAGVRAIVLQPSIVFWMETATCLRCMQTMPTLTFNTAIGALRRLRLSTQRMQVFATLDVHGRVAYQLLFFAERYGVAGHGAAGHDAASQSTSGEASPNDAQSTLIGLRFTQHDLAGLVGSSRQYVNGVLGTFQKLGWISRDADGFFIIHNADALRKRCRR